MVAAPDPFWWGINTHVQCRQEVGAGGRGGGRRLERRRLMKPWTRALKNSGCLPDVFLSFLPPPPQPRFILLIFIWAKRFATYGNSRSRQTG